MAILDDRDCHSDSPLLKEIATIIQSQSTYCPPLIAFPILEKVVYLFNSDFFHRMHSETLIALAERAEVRTFTNNQVITEAGDTCRELLLLIAGSADSHFYLNDRQIRTEQLHVGQTLDELEVLARSDSKNTIVASSELTRILAVPVNAFDDLLDRDRDFSRRVLELESRQVYHLRNGLQLRRSVHRQSRQSTTSHQIKDCEIHSLEESVYRGRNHC